MTTPEEAIKTNCHGAGGRRWVRIASSAGRGGRHLQTQRSIMTHPDGRPTPRGIFTDVDGSTRCVACHLHPDECTCDPSHPMWEILGMLEKAFKR